MMIALSIILNAVALVFAAFFGVSVQLIAREEIQVEKDRAENRAKRQAAITIVLFVTASIIGGWFA